MTRDEFAARYGGLAAQAAGALGIDRGVILAQWALETGWGTSSLAVQHNNLGGIKYTPAGGRLGAKRAGAFASYPSLEVFVEDYIRVMRLGYYDQVRAAPTAEAQVAALSASPYCEGGYTGLTSVWRQNFAGASGGDASRGSTGSSTVPVDVVVPGPALAGVSAGAKAAAGPVLALLLLAAVMAGSVRLVVGDE